jgi:1,4-alpha-glucan branching enzyme
MWAHPGKKLLFMGAELAQEREWSHERSLDWHLLEQPDHAGIQALVRELNRVYRSQPALWELDGEPAGFWWLEPNDVDGNTLSFARASSDQSELIVCAINLNPVPKPVHRIGLPRGGAWREALNTDESRYGGSGMVNGAAIEAQPIAWHGQSHSAEIVLPPLGVVWLEPE